jgi:hypothetical protein
MGPSMIAQQSSKAHHRMALSCKRYVCPSRVNDEASRHVSNIDRRFPARVDWMRRLWNSQVRLGMLLTYIINANIWS